MTNENKILQRINRFLEERKENNLFRKVAPVPHNVRIDVSTNSYLNLHKNESVLADADKLCNKQLSGNLASRLIETVSPLYSELENEIALWKQTEKALVFNSGYAANVGIIQALSSRDTAIFSDKLNHASIVDGIRLSGAKMIRYHHCDMDHLSKLLAKSDAIEKMIVTDSVFSMDGDCAPLAKICDLGKQHDALVFVDEAHGAGVLGERLSGLVEQFHLEDSVHIRMGTMSKAVGGLGGFFAGNTLFYDYLVNTARSFIYSTALPHSVLAYDLAAVRYIRNNPDLGPALLARSQKFKEMVHALGFDTLNSATQIVPCVISDAEKCVNLSKLFLEHGIKVPAIRPPTVPAHTSRLRFSIHLGVTDNDMEKIEAILKDWKSKKNE